MLLGRMRFWVECAARWNVLLEIIETGDGPCLFFVGQGGRRCGVRIGQKQVNCRLDAAGGSPAALKRQKRPKASQLPFRCRWKISSGTQASEKAEKQVNCRLDAAGGSPAALKRHSSARRVHGQARKPFAAHRIIRNQQKDGKNSARKPEIFWEPLDPYVTS